MKFDIVAGVDFVNNTTDKIILAFTTQTLVKQNQINLNGFSISFRHSLKKEIPNQLKLYFRKILSRIGMIPIPSRFGSLSHQ